MSKASASEVLDEVLAVLRRRHGWSVARHHARLVWRGWRWRLTLPGYEGFVAADGPGWDRLRREQELVDAVRPVLGSILPRVVLHDDELRLHLREHVAGASGCSIDPLVFGTQQVPSAELRYHAACPLSPAGSRLAEDLGGALAQLHAGLPVEEARAMGLSVRDPQLTLETVSWVLARQVSDPVLRRGFARARRWWEERYSMRVAVHGSPDSAHLVIDPDTGALRALLDFDRGQLAAREHDLRTLWWYGTAFARQALIAYREIGHTDIDEVEVRRFHVVSVFEQLAAVDPYSPRFSQIVGTARAAVLGLAPRWA